jgi:hypothetical protein
MSNPERHIPQPASNTTTRSVEHRRPRRSFSLSARHQLVGGVRRPPSEQVSLRSRLLAVSRPTGPEHRLESSFGDPALHLLRGQPIGVELDAKASAAACTSVLAIASLKRRHQITPRLDDTGQLAEGDHPAIRREEEQRIPADHPGQGSIPERQITKIGNFEGEVRVVTLSHAHHLRRKIYTMRRQALRCQVRSQPPRPAPDISDGGTQVSSESEFAKQTEYRPIGRHLLQRTCQVVDIELRKNIMRGFQLFSLGVHRRTIAAPSSPAPRRTADRQPGNPPCR